MALLKHQRTYALVLFAIMLMTAAAEVFGLSLVLPLVSGLMGFQDPTSGFADYVRAVTHAMPDGHELEGILVVLVIAFLTKALLVVMRRGMTANYALRLRESWSNRIFSHYLHARLEALGGSKHGVLINNVAAEPLKASKGIVQLLELVAKVLMAGSMFGVLLLTDWKMTLSIGALAGCLLYVIKGRSHAYSVKLGQERMALNQGISADAGDGISALKEVKIYGVERQFQNRLAHKLARYKKIVTKFTILSELPSHLVEPVVVLLLAGLLIFYQYGHGDELKAALPMLAFFMLVAERLFNYASQAITSSMKIASFLPAWRMIHGLVAGTGEEEQAPPGIGISKLDSDIEVCRVHFAYAAHSPVFSGLSLSIPLGKMTAIVGASGVGKTTLVDLVMGLYPVGAGEIRINGRNLREVDLRAWRDRIGYVCQDAHLFHASIEDNILIANPEASRDDVVRAARFANAHEFISAMPRGYETIVGERGTKLSGGQRQRIAIARAVVRDPDVLIFDEATSALDSESERLIRCAVEGLARLKTTIVIAHRMSTIANADFIYELLPEGVAQVTDYDSLRGSIPSPEGDALDPAVRTPLFEDRE